MNSEQSGDAEDQTLENDAEDQPMESVSRVGPVSVDELFDLLAQPANRYVLTYLLLEEGPVSLVDLVEYVVDVTEPPEEMERAEFSGQVLNRFIETTLPELDERGLIDYDRTAQMVAETQATPLTLPYLRATLQQTGAETPERET